MAGNLIRYQDFPAFYVDYLVQLQDSSYRIKTLGFNFFGMPSNWESVNLIPSSFDINFGGGFGDGHYLLDNGKWLFGGTTLIEGSNVADNFYVEQVIAITPLGELEIIFEYADPGRPVMRAGFNGFSFVDTNSMYVSNAYLLNQCDVFEYADCTNFLSLHSFRVDGTLNWSRFVGNDASYLTVQTFATQDTGVVLLAYRYDHNDSVNFAWQAGDIYFLKFDKAGNQLTTSTDLPLGLQINEILLYPNPARDHLRYDYHLPNEPQLTITLYDALGRLVLKDDILDRVTEVSNLATGTYFYVIDNGQEELQAGKVMVGF